jgi:hypothetical protein
MEREYRSLLMAIPTKGCIRMESQQGMGNIFGLLVATSKAILKTDCEMAMESGKEGQATLTSTKESTLMIKSKGMASTPGRTAIFTKGITSTTCGRAMVKCIGQMETYSRGNGSKAFNKDKVLQFDYIRLTAGNELG